MKNYLLDYQLEKTEVHLPWDFSHIELLESLMESTSRFCVELEAVIGQLGIFDYDSVVRWHTENVCDPVKAAEWVFLSLFQKAVQDANGVAVLARASLVSQAVALWRSLFETDVLCQYIADRLSNSHLACRYLIHSVLRPTILRWEGVNRKCRRLGQPPPYADEEIELNKQVYKRVFGKDFGKRGKEYEWTLKSGHNSFSHIAKAVNADTLFYDMANSEVHPTFGVRTAITDLRLPLRAVPLVAVGNADPTGRWSIEYQAVRSVENTARRAPDFITLQPDLRGSMDDVINMACEVRRRWSKAGA